MAILLSLGFFVTEETKAQPLPFSGTKQGNTAFTHRKRLHPHRKAVTENRTHAKAAALCVHFDLFFQRKVSSLVL